jgi:Tfp pilus assembly protein PilN
MRAVNLLPPERRGGRRTASRFAVFSREPLLFAGIALPVLVVGVLGFTAHSASSKAATRNATIHQLDAQIAKLTPATPTVTSGSSRLAAVTTIAGGRTTWDGFLGTVARVIPENVWLLSMTAQGSAVTAPVAPATSTTGAPVATTPLNSVTFTGYTYSQPSVARMMRRLELVPWLQNVNLVTSTKSAINNTTVYQFTVGASFVSIPSLPEVGT